LSISKRLLIMDRSRLLILFVLMIGAPLLGYAQNRYIVFFKDKNGSSFNKADSLAFLSPRALIRRANQTISIQDKDIPVNANYVQEIRDLGVNTFFTTRWMNGVLIQCDESSVTAVEALSFVDRVELVAHGERLSLAGRKGKIAREKRMQAEVTKTQRQFIGLDAMHDLGIHGEDKLIAVLDGGFTGVDIHSPYQHLFLENRIELDNCFDFVANGTDVFQYDNHGTQVLSVMAAVKNDEFIGGAFKATYQLYVTEDVDSEYRIEEYNWLFAAERADSSGVDLISTSLGYYDFDDASMNYTKAQLDGNTTVITRAAQMAADRGIIVVCSAGNEGANAWRTLSAPADAPDVVAVGNVNAQGIRAVTSSTGPSADNRIKPDLATLGQSVAVISGNGNTVSVSGTSVATPSITSLMAGVWQRYPQLSAKEVVALVKGTASQANNPDNEIGYGVPNFKAVVNFHERVEQESPFVVYPNPTTDTLYIRPSDPKVYTTCKFELIDILGRTIVVHHAQFNWLNDEFVGDLSGISSGLYILNVRHGSSTFTFKVVKR
jgi:serine protease AprX